MKRDYLNELDAAYTPLLVIKEASRCLLCHDAPCSQSCPAMTDPGKFIRSVIFRNFKGAAEVIRENNALGSTCGRVCPTEKLCQKACARTGIDQPIEIGKIQTYVTDFERATKMQILKPGKKDKGKIAIVGSGPAGLQASVTLSDLGYDVTVYEKQPKIGGWLRYGIPSYRLPEEILDYEIELIKSIGVTFIPNTKIGEKITLEELKKQNKAVLVTVGFSAGINLPLFKDNPNVEIAADFLSKTKDAKGKVSVPKSAIVIGGGDVAMDVATTLKVLGTESVTCVARESIEEFVASKGELEHARMLNESILDGFTPTKVEGKKVTFSHVKSQGELALTADKIYMAVGQSSDLSAFSGLKTEKGIIVTNNYKTSDEKVFAAGDVIHGDKVVVYAVKYGKEAAHAIDACLKGGK